MQKFITEPGFNRRGSMSRSNDPFDDPFDTGPDRDEPLEENFKMISDIVGYFGAGQMQNPWSAAEFAARKEYGLQKERSRVGDACDPYDPVYGDETTVEIKSASTLPVGRLTFRDEQHQELLSEPHGEYVFVIYQRLNERAVFIADYGRLSAEDVNDTLSEYRWSPRDSAQVQANEIRVPWTEFDCFDSERVKYRAGHMDALFR